MWRGGCGCVGATGQRIAAERAEPAESGQNARTWHQTSARCAGFCCASCCARFCALWSRRPVLFFALFGRSLADRRLPRAVEKKEQDAGSQSRNSLFFKTPICPLLPQQRRRVSRLVHPLGYRHGKPIIKLGLLHLFLVLAATSDHFALRICAGDLKNEPKAAGG